MLEWQAIKLTFFNLHPVPTETYFQVGVVEMLGIAGVVVLSAVVVVSDGCPVMKVLDNVFDWKMDEMEIALLLVLC